ncbi:uncharacterized protein LOC116619398, partial [Nematostella vectensis]|uniref:uncharacterized protein LOC116619398 n=1 Tax=Nematostella vectensis TaxID=45351 RepID=UPI0020772517
KRAAQPEKAKRGQGGKLVKLMVAISYGKGVIECEQYEYLDGKYFSNYIRRKFRGMFKKLNKFPLRLWFKMVTPARIVGTLRKKCKKKRRRALYYTCNKRLAKQVLAQNITKENYALFSKREKETILNFDSHTIDKTIDSMPKRIDMILASKGQRTKY